MKNPHAVALGKRGGEARLKKTTEEQRAQWAMLGGLARARRHSREQLVRWARMGGRPTRKESRQ
jgi:hypothetical protein